MPRGNAKGSAFERSVCRRLTYWITGQEKPEIFWRSAISGAKATQDSKEGRDSHMGGDIMAVHPDGYTFVELFSVECKDRKEFGRIENVLVDEGRSPFMQWWRNCEADAYNSKKIPLLIFKGKWTPTLIMFDALSYTEEWWENSDFLVLMFAKQAFVVMELEKWISRIPPDDWCMHGRNRLTKHPSSVGELIKVKP